MVLIAILQVKLYCSGAFKSNQVFRLENGSVSCYNNSMQVRLQKFIRDCSGISRRKAEGLISAGLVTVNGERAVLGQVVDSGADVVKVSGEEQKADKAPVYIVLNKPRGYTTTRADPHAEKTIYELLPEEFKKLFPVGRLDKDSEGLLFLTNDGDFTYRLTHPKFEVEKEYTVVIRGSLTKKEKENIETGVKTEGFSTSPAKIELIVQNLSNTTLNITIHEGQNREIRRMFGLFNHEVLSLKRIRTHKILLGDLAVGKWRILTDKEVSSVADTVIE